MPKRRLTIEATKEEYGNGDLLKKHVGKMPTGNCNVVIWDIKTQQRWSLNSSNSFKVI